MRDLIRSSREPIQFVEASVQAARASGEAPEVAIAQRIRSAFGADRLDLVMTIGGPAATFAQQFRHELFPATPMLSPASTAASSSRARSPGTRPQWRRSTIRR
jgi:hypothetical protein